MISTGEIKGIGQPIAQSILFIVEHDPQFGSRANRFGLGAEEIRQRLIR